MEVLKDEISAHSVNTGYDEHFPVTTIRDHLESIHSSPKCVFCSMNGQLKLGQGQMLRFCIDMVPEPNPQWFTNYMDQVQIEVNKGMAALQANRVNHATRRNQHSRMLIASPSTLPRNPNLLNVGPHISLDGSRKSERRNSSNGTSCLSLPNAFFDCEGRPFGLVEEIHFMGWPTSPSGTDNLVLSNFITSYQTAGVSENVIHAHFYCALWSFGVQTDDRINLKYVDYAASQALKQTCSLCFRLGASLRCRVPDCPSVFHFLCAAGAGCLQDLETLEMLCPVHLNELHKGGFPSTQCVLCETLGDVTELIFCIGCSSHFHASCLEPALVPNPTIRIGWQCVECKTCLICNENKDENKMMICDVCDKAFHMYCLKPAVSTLPKNGFRCERCRVCSDCGFGRASILNNIDGILPLNFQDSSTVRWHCNFTLCDRCFSARKRPSACCSVCERAWRCSLPVPANISPTNLSSIYVSWPGQKCSKCNRMVHTECDPLIAVNPTSLVLTYQCPPCRRALPACDQQQQMIDLPVDLASLHSTPLSIGSGGLVDDPLLPTTTSLTSSSSSTNPLAMMMITPSFSPNTSSSSSTTTSSNSTTPNTEPGKQLQSGCCSNVADPRSRTMSSNTSSAIGRKRAAFDGSTPATSADGSTSVVIGQQISSKTKPLVVTQQSINSTTHQTTTKTGALKRTSTTSAAAGSSNVTGASGVSAGGGGSNTRSRRTKTRKVALPPPPPPVVTTTPASPSSSKRTHNKRNSSSRSSTPRAGASTSSSITTNSRRRSYPRSLLQIATNNNKHIVTRRPRILLRIKTGAAGSKGNKPSISQPVPDRIEFRKPETLPGTASTSSRNTIDYFCPPSPHESKATEEKDDHPSTIVLYRSDDKFMQENDICIACGSIGLDVQLLACAQCGQCYHPYCADVPKVTPTMLNRGWRCLDCTVCEGCGGTSNESLLLLCDDCDISYHTYCLKPPLNEVPKGGWKCSDCVQCANCSKRDPGVNGKWHANYSLCSPCFSLSTCPTCRIAYAEGDLQIRCALCSRWGHAGCDQLTCEDELEMASEGGYNCPVCRREADAPMGIGHLRVLSYRKATTGSTGLSDDFKLPDGAEALIDNMVSSESGPFRSFDDDGGDEFKQYFIDGVVLTESGLATLRQAMLKTHQPKRPSQQRRTSSTAVTASGQATAPCDSIRSSDTPRSEPTPMVAHGQMDEDGSIQSQADIESAESVAPYHSPSMQSEDDASSIPPTASSSSVYSGDVSLSRPPFTNRPGLGIGPLPGQLNVPAKAASSRAAKRPLNFGIGGFRAKSGRRTQSKKIQLALAAASASTSTTNDSSDHASSNPPSNVTGKQRRRAKKKAEFDELYPDSLMEAFYGRQLLSISRPPVSFAKKTTAAMKLDDDSHHVETGRTLLEELDAEFDQEEEDNDDLEDAGAALRSDCLSSNRLLLRSLIAPNNDVHSDTVLLADDALTIRSGEEEEPSHHQSVVVNQLTQSSSVKHVDSMHVDVDADDEVDPTSIQHSNSPGIEDLMFMDDYLLAMSDELETGGPDVGDLQPSLTSIDRQGQPPSHQPPITSNLQHRDDTDKIADHHLTSRPGQLHQSQLINHNSVSNPISLAMDESITATDPSSLLDSSMLTAAAIDSPILPKSSDSTSHQFVKESSATSASMSSSILENLPELSLTDIETQLGPLPTSLEPFTHEDEDESLMFKGMSSTSAAPARMATSPSQQHLIGQHQFDHHHHQPLSSVNLPVQSTSHLAKQLASPLTPGGRSVVRPSIPSMMMVRDGPLVQQPGSLLIRQQQQQQQALYPSPATTTLPGQPDQHVVVRPATMTTGNLPLPQHLDQGQQRFVRASGHSPQSGTVPSSSSSYLYAQLVSTPSSSRMASITAATAHPSYHQLPDKPPPPPPYPGQSSMNNRPRPLWQQSSASYVAGGVAALSQANYSSHAAGSGTNRPRFTQPHLMPQSPYQMYHQQQATPGGFLTVTVGTATNNQPATLQQQSSSNPAGFRGPSIVDHHNQQRMRLLEQQSRLPPPSPMPHHDPTAGFSGAGSFLVTPATRPLLPPSGQPQPQDPNAIILSPPSVQSPTATRRINSDAKWEEDERLGDLSTIAPVLFANLSCPDLRAQLPQFVDRAKEIKKMWRRLSNEDRSPWVLRARNNRHTLKASGQPLPVAGQTMYHQQPRFPRPPLTPRPHHFGGDHQSLQGVGTGQFTQSVTHLIPRHELPSTVDVNAVSSNVQPRPFYRPQQQLTASSPLLESPIKSSVGSIRYGTGGGMLQQQYGHRKPIPHVTTPMPDHYGQPLSVAPPPAAVHQWRSPAPNLATGPSPPTNSPAAAAGVGTPDKPLHHSTSSSPLSDHHRPDSSGAGQFRQPDQPPPHVPPSFNISPSSSGHHQQQLASSPSLVKRTMPVAVVPQNNSPYSNNPSSPSYAMYHQQQATGPSPPNRCLVSPSGTSPIRQQALPPQPPPPPPTWPPTTSVVSSQQQLTSSSPGGRQLMPPCQTPPPSGSSATTVSPLTGPLRSPSVVPLSSPSQSPVGGPPASPIHHLPHQHRQSTGHSPHQFGHTMQQMQQQHEVLSGSTTNYMSHTPFLQQQPEHSSSRSSNSSSHPPTPVSQSLVEVPPSAVTPGVSGEACVFATKSPMPSCDSGGLSTTTPPATNQPSEVGESSVGSVLHHPSQQQSFYHQPSTLSPRSMTKVVSPPCIPPSTTIDPSRQRLKEALAKQVHQRQQQFQSSLQHQQQQIMRQQQQQQLESDRRSAVIASTTYQQQPSLHVSQQPDYHHRPSPQASLYQQPQWPSPLVGCQSLMPGQEPNQQTGRSSSVPSASYFPGSNLLLQQQSQQLPSHPHAYYQREQPHPIHTTPPPARSSSGVAINRPSFVLPGGQANISPQQRLILSQSHSPHQQGSELARVTSDDSSSGSGQYYSGTSSPMPNSGPVHFPQPIEASFGQQPVQQQSTNVPQQPTTVASTTPERGFEPPVIITRVTLSGGTGTSGGPNGSRDRRYPPAGSSAPLRLPARGGNQHFTNPQQPIVMGQQQPQMPPMQSHYQLPLTQHHQFSNATVNHPGSHIASSNQPFVFSTGQVTNNNSPQVVRQNLELPMQSTMMPTTEVVQQQPPPTPQQHHQSDAF